MILRKTLDDGNEDVCYHPHHRITHFVRRTGSDEATVFQQLIPTILKIELWPSRTRRQPPPWIFDDLIECEVGIVVPHIKPMVELCIALAAETSLDDPFRIKAVTFLNLDELTRLKKKTIVSTNSLCSHDQRYFSIMVQNEDEDNDDDADEDEDTPAWLHSQAARRTSQSSA